MLKKILIFSVAIFLFAQASLEAAEAPKLASRIPEDAVGAAFVTDLPTLARDKAWMNSLSQAFVGEVAVALLDVPQEKKIPPFVIIGEVNREKLRWFLEARLKPILRRNLGEVEFVSSGGVTEIRVNGSPTAFYAVKDGLLSFSLERKVIADFISKPVPVERSLGTNRLFAKFLARTAPKSDFLCFVSVKRILEIFGDKIPERTRHVLKGTGILDIEAVGGCHSAVDGAQLGSLTLITSGKPLGFLSLLGQAQAPPATARFVPGDYSFYARLRFASFSDAWNQLVAALEQLPEGEAEEVIAAFLEGFEEATELDFEEDLLESLGGELAVAVAVPEKLRIPDAVALLELRNREKLEKIIAKLIPGPIGESKEYKGAAIRTFNAGPIMPAYAFLDRYLVVGTDTSAVASVVDTKSGGATLAENPAFRDAAAGLGDAGHIFYLDFGSALPMYFTAIRRAIAEYETEFRAETPKWETIAKLLAAPLLTDVVLACAISGDEESVTFRGYSTISGTYSWIATSGIMAGMLVPPSSRARESARRAACMSNLRQLALGEIMYASDHDGKFSERLSDLYPDYVTSLEVFTCPSAAGPGQWITAKEEVDSLTSYVLRKGVTKASRPDEVLLYEKLENHRGDGGNVAYIDGHVRWLSAPEHQEVIKRDRER